MQEAAVVRTELTGRLADVSKGCFSGDWLSGTVFCPHPHLSITKTLWWLGWEMSRIKSWIWTLSLQFLAELFGGGYGTLLGTASLEEVCHWRQALKVYSLVLLFFSFPTFWMPLRCGVLASCSCFHPVPSPLWQTFYCSGTCSSLCYCWSQCF